MAISQFQVETYEYYFWSSRTSTKANLNLRSSDGKTCSVWFKEDPNAELAEAQEIAPDYFAFYYHYHQLDQLIDMLRNEKPVWVFFNNENGFPNSRISTTREPVGEGEMA